MSDKNSAFVGKSEGIQEIPQNKKIHKKKMQTMATWDSHIHSFSKFVEILLCAGQRAKDHGIQKETWISPCWSLQMLIDLLSHNFKNKCKARSLRSTWKERVMVL